MWLLSTDKVELRYFHSPADVPSGYAILSHVWQSHEQSFQHVQELQRSGRGYEVGSKIRGCVEAATQFGHAWVWVDTCCINKTNSSELEEAINSMFRWYAEAGVCLAYLQDVSDDCNVEAPQSDFRKSRWFLRGWTLQELIAPRQLVFMSKDWKCLGTKASLANLVEEITGIDAEVLTFSKYLGHVSVGRRMSWASSRVTSKVEDEAYSLMGLFDVNMPTIYGEGKNAFRRLQEEIMKRSPDHTLFAWGNLMPEIAETWTSQSHRHKKDVASSLLASSPADFFALPTTEHSHLTQISVDSMKELVRDHIDITDTNYSGMCEHAVTSHGIRCHLAVVHGDPFSIALLPCQDSFGRCQGLLLWRRPSPADDVPQYLVGASFQPTGDHTGPSDGSQQSQGVLGYRLIAIRPSTIAAILNYSRQSVSLGSYTPPADPGEAETTPKVHAAFEQIHIVNTTASMLPLSHPWHLQLHCAEPRRVMIPTWVRAHLERCSFIIQPKDSPSPSVFGLVMEPPCKLTLVSVSLQETIVIEMGHLDKSLSICVSVAFLPLADVDGGDVSPGKAYTISSWNNGSQTYSTAERRLRLTATRWPTPDCYCMEIRLEGLPCATPGIQRSETIEVAAVTSTYRRIHGSSSTNEKLPSSVVREHHSAPHYSIGRRRPRKSAQDHSRLRIPRQLWQAICRKWHVASEPQ